MGVYLLDSAVHGPLGKVSTLVAQGAVRATEPETFEAIPAGQTLICVIENPAFEAAGVVYCPAELRRFKYDESTRPKTWLLLSTPTVKQLLPPKWAALIT